ncbi:MAG: transporter substrate-binding protein [Herminiimonas sp.]|nr:transporter substrate-binding protein [Herminiimonas sp.]MDB5853092.1 transporter substrate-binding protein [Herminiimonas sp.]
MSSRFHRFAMLLVLTVAVSGWAASSGPFILSSPAVDHKRELRVCADPDNLPYSHEDESGFENRIARLVAEDMGAALHYYWLPQRRGFVRKTMGQGLCDVFIGVPSRFERVLTTRPYYRSSYVFVTRRGEPPGSLDTARLRSSRIGVQLVGNDLAATPPGHALTQVGMTDNVVGFTIFGDGSAAQRMVDALAARKLDVALIWGPQAGWTARRAAVPMDVAIAHAPTNLPVPFEFSISMGVARGNQALRDELDAVLLRRRGDIDAILTEYAVPRTDVREGAQYR